MRRAFFLLLLCIACSEENEDIVVLPDACANVVSTYEITLDTSGCNVDIESKLGVNSRYDEQIVGNKRLITFNNIANHPVGNFPRAGNPNTISANVHSVEITINPQVTTSFNSAKGYDLGILSSGVAIDPFTAKFLLTAPNPTAVGMKRR